MVQISEVAVDAGVGGVAGLFTSDGTLEIRTGSGPADISDSDTGDLLVSFPLGNPAFSGPTEGTVVLLDTPLEQTAVDSGTAGHFRFKVDGNPVIQGSVSTSSADLTIDNDNIVEDQNVIVSALTMTLPDQAE